MKTGSKVLLAVSSAAVLVTGSVFGTLAYLTDVEEVQNTFTIGKVDISLEETLVNENGKPVDEEGNPTTDSTKMVTTNKNNYHLMPGSTYTKDPTMTVEAGSDSAYLRIKMTVHDYADVQKIIGNSKHGLTDFTDLLDGWDSTEWICETKAADTVADTITYEFRYKEPVSALSDTDGDGKNDAVTLSPLFTELVIPGTLDSDEIASLDKFEMVLVGHAIQANGFDEDTAWTEFDEQES